MPGERRETDLADGDQRRGWSPKESAPYLRVYRASALITPVILITGFCVLAYLVTRQRDDAAGLEREWVAAVGTFDGRLSALNQRLARIESIAREGLMASKPSSESEARAPGATRPSAALQAPPCVDRAEEDRSPDAADDETLIQSQRLLEHAISAGRWTEEDRLKLFSMGSSLSRDQDYEIKRTLSQHINEGRIRVETERLPF